MRRLRPLALPLAVSCALSATFSVAAEDAEPAPQDAVVEPLDEEAASDAIDEVDVEDADADEADAAEAQEVDETADEEPADDEAGGVFVHEPGSAIYGFFAPILSDDAAAPGVGDLMLDHFHLGDDADLAAWEAGERLSEVYAPVMFEFANTASERVENELGAVVYIDRPRALPTAYSVTAETIRFVGALPDGAPVLFEGRFDRAALEAAVRDGASQTPSLVGDLTVGEETFEAIGFAYWAGD